jgi:hypothetical protein
MVFPAVGPAHVLRFDLNWDGQVSAAIRLNDEFVQQFGGGTFNPARAVMGPSFALGRAKRLPHGLDHAKTPAHGRRLQCQRYR